MYSWIFDGAVERPRLSERYPYCIKTVINPFVIKRVIFNAPATIVYWEDGTKTVVKCGTNDIFDEEKGLALCFMKKACNNKGAFNNILKQYCHV